MDRKRGHTRARRGAIAAGIATLLLAAAGCGKDDSSTAQRPSGPVAGAKTISGGSTFTSPFDAVPSKLGDRVFFTALGPDGDPGVFAAASDANATALKVGSPFVAPNGIAIDDEDAQLFVADPLAGNDGLDRGAVFVVDPSSGGARALSGTAGLSPRGVLVDHQRLLFTGVSPDGVAGLMSVPLGGGTATPLATGAPFVEPGSIAIDGRGVIYVADGAAGPGESGAIVEVRDGAARVVKSGIAVSGLTLGTDDSWLMVSALGNRVVRWEPASDAVHEESGGAAGLVDVGGVHRSKDATSTFAWTDALAGDGNGAIHLLTK
ncbi:MAG: hypothetical protein NVS3B10_16850 [Polyangiales bacterium]